MINNFFKKSFMDLEKKERKNLFIPTPFDNLDPKSQFDLFTNFLNKEFFYLIYEFTHSDKISNRNNYYKDTFLSFILLFSINISDKTVLKKNDEIIDTKYIEIIKERFYEEFTFNCINKMSRHLKTIFYRNYNRTTLKKVQLVKQSRYTTLLKKLDKILKNKKNLYERIENVLHKIIIDIVLEEDKVLFDYLIDWCTMKIDFIMTDIILIKQNLIKENDNLKPLLTISFNYWGEERLLDFQNRKAEEIEILVNEINFSIEKTYFMTIFKSLFDN